MFATSFTVDVADDFVDDDVNDDTLLNDGKIIIRSNEPYDDEGIPYNLYSKELRTSPSGPINEIIIPKLNLIVMGI